MKEQQLKEEFHKWELIQKIQPLESDHATQFLIRLNKRNKRAQMRNVFQWAAVVLICIGLGGAFQFSQEQLPDEVIQFEKAEFHLMQLIDEQLNEFENSNSPATQKILIQSKKQLETIQTNYDQIYKQWEANPNQPQLIQALIGNLNTQINLLTEINNILKTIKKTHYEELKI
ncbi:MAG: hypothetical protein P8H38_02635 [Flavobacteriaceae bacterium]|nr:hypothetical protein [Flavobacteriaceae bacterium]